jgi:16S rRNA (guanine(966)-N(2))-methyltransferase RsmD
MSIEKPILRVELSAPLVGGGIQTEDNLFLPISPSSGLCDIQSRMRIIAGEGHGRKLRVPKGGETRSTASRVKQTYFDIMRPAIEGATFLDACAGSGALGIEAVSRGAAHATLIDRSHAAVASALQNIRVLGDLSRSVEVLEGDLLRTLRKLRVEGRTFDVVYLDPPYEEGPYEEALELLAGGLVSARGYVTVEHFKKRALPEAILSLVRIREVKVSDHRLTIYRNEVFE